MMQDQPPDLDWRDGQVPVSLRFDDPYFSLDDGLAETEYVFLAGNDLPARFGGAFAIAELGFGTGLNCLVTLDAWHKAGRPGQVTFTSFEAYPMTADDMAKALSAFPSLAALAAPFLQALAAGSGPWPLAPGFVLSVIEGDARETLPRWPGLADAWYLDGFSPAKNPEMWGEALLSEVACHTAPGGTLASYTAAGHVRRALAAAGLEVARRPGYGRKRHMTVARKP
jgi:tRNA U34 5-methylaminomethyl-2-thiouridine-forming methyltransferase MnmC